MRKALVVFKGWGSTDAIYTKFSEVFNADIIFSEDLHLQKLNQFDKIMVLGWSMGTLDCIRFIRENNIEKSVLIAPTLNFTKTTRPLIIKKMIKRLKIERAGCLKDFIELNFSDVLKFEEYLGEYFEDILRTHDDELIAGLTKLMEDRVENVKCNLSPLILLGTEDRVILQENSRDVVESFPNAVVQMIDGGHNLIYESWDQIEEAVKKYLNM